MPDGSSNNTQNKNTVTIDPKTYANRIKALDEERNKYVRDFEYRGVKTYEAYLETEKESEHIAMMKTKLGEELSVFNEGPKGKDPASMLDWISKLPGFIGAEYMELTDYDIVDCSSAQHALAQGWFYIMSDEQARDIILSGKDPALIKDPNTLQRLKTFDRNFAKFFPDAVNVEPYVKEEEISAKLAKTQSEEHQAEKPVDDITRLASDFQKGKIKDITKLDTYLESLPDLAYTGTVEEPTKYTDSIINNFGKFFNTAAEKLEYARHYESTHLFATEAEKHFIFHLKYNCLTDALSSKVNEHFSGSKAPDRAQIRETAALFREFRMMQDEYKDHANSPFDRHSANSERVQANLKKVTKLVPKFENLVNNKSPRLKIGNKNTDLSGLNLNQEQLAKKLKSGEQVICYPDSGDLGKTAVNRNGLAVALNTGTDGSAAKGVWTYIAVPNHDLADGNQLMTQLKGLQKRLSDTDPIWLLTNTDAFKNLKTELNETIKALDANNGNAVFEMSKLAETANKYIKNKQDDAFVGSKNRDFQRFEIASAIGAYARGYVLERHMESAIKAMDELVSPKEPKSEREINQIAGTFQTALQSAQNPPVQEVFVNTLAVKYASAMNELQKSGRTQVIDLFSKGLEYQKVTKDIQKELFDRARAVSGAVKKNNAEPVKQGKIGQPEVNKEISGLVH